MFDSFLTEWKFARGLSLDLLESLCDDDMAYSPGFGLGPFWKQFRHVARVQKDYADALVTGKIEFGRSRVFAPGDFGVTVSGCKDSLRRCDEEMLSVLSSTGQEAIVSWFGDDVGSYEHMWRLVGHETFHHGQWVIYMRGLGKPFPQSWSAWGF